jgi:UDP-3-O-[3-hydroxymyristoyl] N-acetylglucosamine deacetylase
MQFVRQKTIAERAEIRGKGVHSNSPVRLVLNPAPAGHGIVFHRTALADGASRRIPAMWSNVCMTELCTVVGDMKLGSVSTIEHLMSAVLALGIDNLDIEIDGPEVPIMDGSAREFVELIDNTGLTDLDAQKRYVKVLKPVRIEHGRGFSELRPASQGFHLDVEIDFSAPIIGRQRKVIELSPEIFREEIQAARTFGFLRDVEHLWKAGFALGSSLENSVALDGDKILNPEGLRYPDEFVRHKMLDAIGDLSLAGAPIIGTYRSYCGGHKMNSLVLEALFKDPSAFTYVEAPARREAAATPASIQAESAFS